MQIILYQNKDESNKVSKNLLNALTLEDCTLRDTVSITAPVITVTMHNPVGYNYCYLPDFGRFYFVNDITAIRTGVWQLSLQVDVLMSFKDEIRNMTAILERTEQRVADNYLSDPVWRTQVKTKTDILNFPSGLLESGEYILITAGG